MLRHVSSTPQLCKAHGAALSQNTSSLHHSNSHRRKQSIASDPRPRSASIQDLSRLVLDEESSAGILISRPSSPGISTLLHAVPESPVGSPPEPESLFTEGFLSRLNSAKDSLGDLVLPEHLLKCSTTTITKPRAVAEEDPSSLLFARTHIHQLHINTPPYAFPVASSTPDSPSSDTTLPGSPTLLSTTPSATPLPPILPKQPSSTEVRVYRKHMNLDFVSEMLSALSHTQQLAAAASAQVAAGLPSSTAAITKAAGAASMLVRGLARAATRLCAAGTNATGGKAGGGAEGTSNSMLLLPLEALFTVQEYGWSDVVTLDCVTADAMGMCDMEAHDLATGRAVQYHRPAVREPWSKVGTTPTSLTSLLQELGNPPCALLFSAARAAGIDPTLSPSLMTPSLTLSGLAAHLASLSEGVSRVAVAMKSWVDQVATSIVMPLTTAAAVGVMGAAAAGVGAVASGVAAGGQQAGVQGAKAGQQAGGWAGLMVGA